LLLILQKSEKNTLLDASNNKPKIGHVDVLHDEVLVEHSPLGEANSTLPVKKLLAFITHNGSLPGTNSLPLDPITSQMNPIHTHPTSQRTNLTLTSIYAQDLQVVFSLQAYKKNLLCISHLPTAHCIPNHLILSFSHHGDAA
jgi:hypothetical protein